MKIETRQIIEAAELRAADDQPDRLTGYAAVFNSLSEDLGGFRERIAPGAFKRTLNDNADVLALVGHKRDLPLGRTASGTLTLAEDDRGLRIAIDLPDTSYARDLRASVKRRDITGMSFGFSVAEDGRTLAQGGRADYPRAAGPGPVRGVGGDNARLSVHVGGTAGGGPRRRRPRLGNGHLSRTAGVEPEVGRAAAGDVGVTTARPALKRIFTCRKIILPPTRPTSGTIH